MATRIIYRSHVRSNDMVITPDLALSRLFIFTSNKAYPLSVARIMTDQHVQAIDLEPKLIPAAALIAASEGVLVAPAAVIVNAAAHGEHVQMTSADVALSRQCWRLKDTGNSLSFWLDGIEEDTIDAAQVIGAREGAGAVLPYGEIVVAAFGKGARLTSGRHESAISAGGRTLTHAFEIELLPPI